MIQVADVMNWVPMLQGPRHGFIRLEGGPDMLVLPKSKPGRKVPAPGAFMVCEIVTDTRTGRPRAENVRYD